MTDDQDQRVAAAAVKRMLERRNPSYVLLARRNERLREENQRLRAALEWIRDGIDQLYSVTNEHGLRRLPPELEGHAGIISGLHKTALIALGEGESLLERVRELEAALEWYADEDRYSVERPRVLESNNPTHLPPIIWDATDAQFDAGQRARAALSSEDGTGER